MANIRHACLSAGHTSKADESGTGWKCFLRGDFTWHLGLFLREMWFIGCSCMHCAFNHTCMLLKNMYVYLVVLLLVCSHCFVDVKQVGITFFINRVVSLLFECRWWCQVLAQWYNIPEQQSCDPGGHWWRWWCSALCNWPTCLLPTSLYWWYWVCFRELVLPKWN